MFYPEYILLILIIVTFNLHVQIKNIDSFFIFNTSPILFGFLSLHSIYNITNETSLHHIILFIINDRSGMSLFVELYLLIFALCAGFICYNFYIVYSESYLK